MINLAAEPSAASLDHDVGIFPIIQAVHASGRLISEVSDSEMRLIQEIPMLLTT